MKIYFVTRSYLPDITGGTLIRKAQVDLFKKNGFDVIVITPNYKNDELIIDGGIIRIPFIESVKINLIKERLGLKEDYLDRWVIDAYEYMKDIIKKEDILFCTSGGELSCIKLGVLLKEYKLNHLIINLHDPIDGTTVNGKNYAFYIKKRNKLEYKYLMKANKIIVSSELNQNSLMEKGISKERLLINYFGYKKKIQNLKRKNKFVFGYGGNFSKLQKPSMLLRALEKSGSESKCIFIGDVSKDSYIEKSSYTHLEKMDSMSHEAYINFFAKEVDIGFMSLSNDYLGACVPSKLFEYINLEKPIYAIIPYGDAYNIINENKYGVACYYKNIEEIEAGLRRIMNKEFYNDCKANIIRDKDKWYMESKFKNMLDEIGL